MIKPGNHKKSQATGFPRCTKSPLNTVGLGHFNLLWIPLAWDILISEIKSWVEWSPLGMCGSIQTQEVSILMRRFVFRQAGVRSGVKPPGETQCICSSRSWNRSRKSNCHDRTCCRRNKYLWSLEQACGTDSRARRELFSLLTRLAIHTC